MDLPSATKKPWWISNYLLMVFLTLPPAALYLYVTWLTTSNTPAGDGYIQSLFTILYWKDGSTLSEQLHNTWWTYFQHRSVFSKLATLSLYAILGSVDLRIEGLVGNASLVLLVWLIALNCHQHKLPAYSIVVTSLLILSIYAWTVATWPECALFYFSTLALAFLAFYLLDLPQPRVLTAVICSWLAAFTMANGLLSVVVGSLIITYRHLYCRRYTNAQIIIWVIGAIGCLSLHLATMNVFSTELFGAKSVHDSFINIPERLLDFVESMGAVPLPPNEYRLGKIILGGLILTTSLTLLTSRKSWESPAIVGLLLFNTGTIFLTSLFRYSAGGNDGYQIFTATNFAALFVIASLHIKHKNWHLPLLLCLMAAACNSNALLENIPKMILKKQEATQELQTFLTSSKDTPNSWYNVILRESISANIYRPLQVHDSLPIAQFIQPIDTCPAATTAITGNLNIKTDSDAPAIQMDITLPQTDLPEPSQLFLCGKNQRNYRVTLNKGNILKSTGGDQLTILFDKRDIAEGRYNLSIDTGGGVLTTSKIFTATSAKVWTRNQRDCETMRLFSRWKAFEPLVQHYCAL